MSGIQLRDAVDTDLEAVSAIARAAFDLDRVDAASIPGYVWAQPDIAGWDEGTGSSGRVVRIRRVAVAEEEVLGLLIGTVWAEQAFLDLLVVSPRARRRGLGQALLRDWEGIARSLGGRDLQIGGNLLGYAWPGVDIRYTAAICLLLRNGYVRNDIAYNMDLPISSEIAPRATDINHLRQLGITLRRGRLDTDGESLPTHARTTWSPAWGREVAIALRRQPATVFVACRDEAIVGFAAYGVYRPSLYGPIATDPALQGLGVGHALSRMCLLDMVRAGLSAAEIGWVAESAIPFYSTTVGARLGRCFWMFHKDAGGMPQPARTTEP